ncbi:MAG: sigma 54-interacting transcriptional regulator [Clostridium celatum]|nr:sigma 54-interacting transcriptional regulator [Clostridium celatum]
MKIKEKVCVNLEKLSEKAIKDGKKGITASEIGNILKVQRNVVSQYLNELCREGKAIKINTRPVYFLHSKSIVVNKDELESNLDNDPFIKLIGYNGSLREAVEQCKSAAVYPNKGLPITLIGNSGVGKSFIASLIHEYALYKGVINESAPFITFNCADYANNPELLSSNLFGYKKGAFTGAEKDTMGLIEAADGGYLFLDEVHRLPPEGQEKLFLFLDQGRFRRVGETNKWTTAKVRFIFATTENLEDVFLDTFKRRIPIFVEIPSIDKRSVSERVNMIYNFYLQEAKEIDRDLIINRNVINSLIAIKGNGNVGLLKNIIISSCANSYRSNLESEVIEVNIKDLPGEFKNKTNIKNIICNENIKIYRDKSNINSIKYIGSNKNSIILEEIEYILKLINNLNTSIITEEQFKKFVNGSLNKIFNEMIFNNSYIEKDILTYKLMSDVIENALVSLQKNYGLKFYGNTTKIMTYSIIVFRSIFNENKDEEREYKYYKKILKKKLSKSYLIVNKIVEIMERTLDYSVDDILKIILVLYIDKLVSHDKVNCNAIIVAHGYSTASSIAAVANTYFEQFIFEAFDMPIDVTTTTVVRKIKDYLTNINTNNGTILLVDMGSLNQIYTELRNTVNGHVGIINNISTRLALDVANKIINNENIEDIVKECSNNNKTEYRFYKAPKKKNAIVVTCISGIGTAEKIRNILTNCIGEAEIEIIAKDYNSVVNYTKEDFLNNGYDVKLIISTTALESEDIKVIELQNLITTGAQEIIDEVLEGVVKKKKIEEIQNDMIKLFSLQNILNQLTILNPDKIVNEVDKIINNYQIGLNIKFEADLKLALFIHISMLIERLVLRENIISYPNEEKFKQCHNDFVELSQEIFRNVLKEYRVSLSLGEIIIIHDIINFRYKNKLKNDNYD